MAAFTNRSQLQVLNPGGKFVSSFFLNLTVGMKEIDEKGKKKKDSWGVSKKKK